MTYINEIDDDFTRERLRGEILENVRSRRGEQGKAFQVLTTFLGVVYSGGVVSSLGFIASIPADAVPFSAIVSFLMFSLALFLFAVLLHAHYQLHIKRDNHYARIAQGFFTRKNTVQDLLDAEHEFRSGSLYQTLFYVPYCIAFLGFVFGVLAVFGF